MWTGARGAPVHQFKKLKTGVLKLKVFKTAVVKMKTRFWNLKFSKLQVFNFKNCGVVWAGGLAVSPKVLKARLRKFKNLNLSTAGDFYYKTLTLAKMSSGYLRI